MATAEALDPNLVARLHREAGAAHWHVSPETFAAALTCGLAKAYPTAQPVASTAERFVCGLHLADLALACGCAQGNDDAWQYFIDSYRPVLYRAADALEPGGGARELADALYADLFGVANPGGAGRSLFRYYHGRSSLATWLRAVLAQRFVDRVRSRRRTEPLPEPESPREPAAPVTAPAPDHGRFLTLMRAALTVAIAALLPPDRLRLSCYYARQMTLAQIGQLLGEHEATVSRHVAKSRRQIRDAVERFLETSGLGAAEIDECFRSIAADAGDLDLQQLLLLDSSQPDVRKDPAPARSTGETV